MVRGEGLEPTAFCSGGARDNPHQTTEANSTEE